MPKSLTPTTKSIARQVGIGEMTMRRLLSGLEVRRAIAERVAKALALDPDFIMNGPRKEVRARIVSQAALLEVAHENQPRATVSARFDFSREGSHEPCSLLRTPVEGRSGTDYSHHQDSGRLP